MYLFVMTQGRKVFDCVKLSLENNKRKRKHANQVLEETLS